jgi:4-diphosphocytidyl-2C-methyl-D-erythritol kinase
MALDRGIEIYDLPDIAKQPVLLVSPGLHVATGPAYGALGRSLTFTSLSSSINSFQAFVRALGDGRSAMAASAFSANDFETVVFKQYPQLKKIATRLRGVSASGVSPHIRMTGSGSTIFALFSSQEDRAHAMQVLDGDRVLKGCKVLEAELVSRKSYRRLWQRQLREHLNPNEVLWPPRSRYAR